MDKKWLANLGAGGRIWLSYTAIATVTPGTTVKISVYGTASPGPVFDTASHVNLSAWEIA
jgi:hypothetical protein